MGAQMIGIPGAPVTAIGKDFRNEIWRARVMSTS